MKEELIHYVWRLQRFDKTSLTTVDNLPIEIVHPGQYNTNAGPDFLQAKIKVGDTLWAGQVEMHVKGSDWYRHHHDEDLAYDNVILHVVWDNDRPVLRANGQAIPTLLIDHLIDPSLIQQFETLLQQESWVYCEKRIHEVSDLQILNWKERLLVDRWQHKIQPIEEDLNQSVSDWEQVFLQYLAMHLGTHVNQFPFKLLFKNTPLKILQKHRDNIFQLEAILFGQAGMLEQDLKDDYPKKLTDEYQHLSKKYQLEPIAGSTWKFMRMRPANFPTIRIAQLAQILMKTEHLFNKCLAANSISEIVNMFDIKADNYWKTHYVFDKESVNSKTKSLGKSTIYNILINTICPFLFLYGKHTGDEAKQDKAFELLRAIPSEVNRITKNWKNLGIDMDSAYDSQAMIQLKNAYCKQQRCLQCQIGHAILK